MKTLLLPTFCLVIIAAHSQKQAFDFSKVYSQNITIAGLKEKLAVIASADMEGRETATPGQRKAAAYIQNHFQKLGLLPGTTGGYQMQFPVYQDSLIEASLQVNEKMHKLNENFTLDIASAANGTFSIDEIVFVSHGIVDSIHNDYKDHNVKGKWVLFFEDTPVDDSLTDRRARYTKTEKILQAKVLGANGIFIMATDFVKKAGENKGKMYLKKQQAERVPVITVSASLAHQLLGLDAERLLENIKIVPTGSYKTKVQFLINKRTITLGSSNVIAVLPGTDKKDEFVLITSHYDHLGKNGDEIFYGADDDGSGTTGVLQIAEAFAKAKNEGRGPRRSIIFMTVSGEEKGLLGSEFYSEHPAFALHKTSVGLNIDMVGRIDPKYKGDSLNYIYIIGDDKLSSELRPVTDSLNDRYLRLQLDRQFNDLNDINRYYYRSDHYNFAKKGVPVIFYFNGTHADYHRTTDTVDKINFDLLAKRVKLVFFTAWEMANRNEMIKRDLAPQR